VLNQADRTSFGEGDFAAVMARLGPWERAPHLAVAVSGGADSLALTLLAAQWTRERGGTVTAMTVDHALRAASADEARQVADWLAARGVAHVTLRWEGDKPANGIQDAAREARYELLRRAAAERGILHLLLAHHQDDQAETLLQRLTRGSGVDGLAAMSPQVNLPELRLLRPLLEAPRSALQAYLQDLGQDWIEDPSNRSPKFQRVRLRNLLQDEGLEAKRLAATSRALGRARQTLEQAAADLAARAVSLHQAGYARLDLVPLLAAPDEVSLRVLAACCRTIAGGVDYPPRLEKLERLLAELRGGLAGRRSFGGCLMTPSKGLLLIGREPQRMAGPVAAKGGQTIRWDGRFTLSLDGAGAGQVAALGRDGVAALRKIMDDLPFPAAIAATLPAVCDAAGVSAVPHLGYNRPGNRELACESVFFTPSRPMAGFVHCLV